MIRNVLGVLGGLLVWVPVFFLVASLPVLVWPAYDAAADVFRATGRYEFNAAMSALNVIFWIVAETFAGWLAVVIAKHGGVAYVLATLMLAYMSFNHLYYYWDRFPWWYNLAVVIPVVPAVLLGSRLAGRGPLRSQPVRAASDLTHVK